MGSGDWIESRGEILPHTAKKSFKKINKNIKVVKNKQYQTALDIVTLYTTAI